MNKNYDNLDNIKLLTKSEAIYWKHRIEEYIVAHPRVMEAQYPSEAAFQTKLIQTFRKIGLAQIMWWSKISDRYNSGIPDILICLSGMFIGMELKQPTGRVSALQEHTINNIADAGGIVCTSTNIERSLRMLAQALEIYAIRL